MSSDTKTQTPVMQNPLEITDTVDWGAIPTMIEGESRTSGKLLYKGADGHPESGVWICTPGYWNCHVTEDEFCHFLAGRCTYTHESGEVIEIGPRGIIGLQYPAAIGIFLDRIGLDEADRIGRRVIEFGQHHRQPVEVLAAARKGQLMTGHRRLPF